MAPQTLETAPPTISSPAAQHDNNSTETTVALVALVFAIIAFIAAFFQALLQYLTSSQRDKCLSGAIGGWSKYTKTLWDLSRWRIRVLYPRLTLEWSRILRTRDKHREALADWSKINIPHLVRSYQLKRNYARSRGITIKGDFWLIEDRGSIAIGPDDKPITFWQLSIQQKISWLSFWLRYRRRGKQALAKAGWANFMASLSITPDECLIDGFNEADIIPSGVDVPIQTIKLYDLALLCYISSIKDVRLDSSQGIINAENAFVKVTTQEVPGWGKAVTINGDFDQLESYLTICGSGQLGDIEASARGFLPGDTFFPHIDYFDERALLLGLVCRWTRAEWGKCRIALSTSLFERFPDSERRMQYLVATSPAKQATEYANHASNITARPWAEFWADLIGGSSPSVLKYMAVMPFSGIWSAAPLRMFIKPFWTHLDKQRREWYRTQAEANPLNLQASNYTLKLRQHSSIELGLTFGMVPFLIASSVFCLPRASRAVVATSIGGKYKFSWAIYPYKTILDDWNSPASLAACSVGNPELYLPEVVLRLLDGSCTSIDEARKWVVYSNVNPKGRYTLEAAIFLALCLADGRLQALLTALEYGSEGQFFKFYTEVERINAMKLGPEETMNGISGAIRRTKWAIEVSTGDFLALWFEIGRRTDLTGDTALLWQELLNILEDWETDETPCISELPDQEVPDVVGDWWWWRALDSEAKSYSARANTANTVAGSKSRKDYVLWARSVGGDGVTRLDRIREMLPVLQLRVFLMDLAYRCHADSSDVCLAEYDNAPAIRLI
ncbi:hypothetical protein TWF281_011062 [Arthrobotrys megalospora]